MTKAIALFAIAVALMLGGMASWSCGQDFDPRPQTDLVTFGASFADGPDAGIKTASLAEIKTDWKWSQPADHHGAIVRVWTPEGAGTGAMIGFDGPGALILTAYHVIQPFGSATITSTRTGNRFSSRVLYQDRETDVAILYAHHAEPKVTLSVGKFIPEKTEPCEIVGLGGPQGNTLRHFAAPYLGTRYDRWDYDTPVISGDSGSPIIYRNDAVIGLVRGGSYYRCPEHLTRAAIVHDQRGRQHAYCQQCQKVLKWPDAYPAQSNVSGPTLASQVASVCQSNGWTARIVDSQCQPCQPGWQPMPTAPTQPTRPLYPPTQPTKPTQPTNPTCPQQCQDCEDGKDGADGRGITKAEITGDDLVITYTDGTTENAGKVTGADGAAVDPEELRKIVLSIVRADPELFRGPKGETGEAGDISNIDPEQLAAIIQPYLDGITYQPGVIEGGKLIPAGEPWQAKLGGPPTILPPMRLNVHNWDGNTTVTQGPLGGGIGMEMVRP